jgi:hypothetical protein
VRLAAPEAVVPVAAPAARPAKLMDRWPETNQDLIQLDPRELDPQPTPEPKSSVNMSQLALFVSIVLAIVSVIEVATGRQGTRVGSAVPRSTDARTHWASGS